MKRIHAKSCVISDVSEELEIDFLKENHRQGFVKSYKRYGLFYKGELVFLMTFGSPRYNKNYQWEIIRECSKKDYSIYEATSTIWKHFLAKNSCHSCICYSYPHNGKYTGHYVDHCGFKNIQKTFKKDKLYYIGSYNNKNYEISIQQLRRFGVDRLLNTKFGNSNGTNEDILHSLNFEKVKKEKDEPQVDIYFPFGIVYKIIDTVTKEFYIGKTESKEAWKSGYLGSGTAWERHIKKFPDIEANPDNDSAHKYNRIILKDNFKTPKELFDYEVEMIKEHGKAKQLDNGKWVITDAKCKNLAVRRQNEWEPKENKYSTNCFECGGVIGHKKTCSKYKRSIAKKCEFCGSPSKHKKWCPNYSEPKPCPKCGAKYTHKKSCVYYNKKPCQECGSTNIQHHPTCSKYKKPKFHCDCCDGTFRHRSWCVNFNGSSGLKPTDVLYVCTECRGINGKHKRNCAQRMNVTLCEECGGIRGKHKKGCSKYKEPTPCKECGGKNSHKKDCSNYVVKNACSNCGTPPGGRHKKDCPARVIKLCSECGNSVTRHKRSCSKYVKHECSECGSIGAVHKKSCSKYKAIKPCSECGGIDGKHRKTCSKYVRPKNSCPFCGTPPGGRHKKDCTNFKPIICCECGGRSGKHRQTCSKHKDLKRCPHCGSTTRHKKWCPDNHS